jgi:hypothetical protein
MPRFQFSKYCQGKIAKTTSWQKLAFTTHTDELTVAVPVVLNSNNRFVKISGLNKKVPVYLKISHW